MESNKNSTKENTIPDILMPLLMGSVLVSGIKTNSNKSKVLKFPEAKAKPKILVKKETNSTCGIGLGFYAEKDVNNEYVDMFVISTGNAYESKSHKISIRKPANLYASLGFPRDCHIGLRDYEIPIQKSGAYIYTDTQGTSKMMSYDEICTEVDKRTHEYRNNPFNWANTKESPESIKYAAKNLNEKLIFRPYVPIGIRIFKNHKIFMLYGKGIPNQDGSIDNKIYMGRHSKKATSKSVDFIDAITSYDKELLNYVEGYSKIPNGTLVYDARIIPSFLNEKDEKYDLALLAVSGIIKERSVQLHSNTVDIFTSVFGNESCRFVCDLKKEYIDEDEDTVNRHIPAWRRQNLGYTRLNNFKTLSYVDSSVYMTSLGIILARGFEKVYHVIDDEWCIPKNYVKNYLKPNLDLNTYFVDDWILAHLSAKKSELVNKLLSKLFVKLKSAETSANSSKSVTKKPKKSKIDDSNPTSKAAIDRVNLKNITALMDSNKLFINEKDLICLSRLGENSIHTGYCNYLRDILNIRSSYRFNDTGYECDICTTDIIEHNGMLYNIFKEFKIFIRNGNRIGSNLRLFESDVFSIIENSDKGVVRVYLADKNRDTWRPDIDRDYSPLKPFATNRGLERVLIDLELNLEKIIIIPVTRGTVNYYEYDGLTKASYGRTTQILDREFFWSSTSPRYIWELNYVNNTIDKTVTLCNTIKNGCTTYDANKGMERAIFDTANIFNDSRSGLKDAIPKHQICSKILLDNREMRDIYLSKVPKGYWTSFYTSLKKMVLSNVMIPKTRYIRAAFEQGDACGIDRRLLYVLGTDINWVRDKRGVSKEAAKNKYYRSLSDIFVGLPHNKIKILVNCFNKLIKNHGLFGCCLLADIIRFLAGSDCSMPFDGLTLGFATGECHFRWGGRYYQQNEDLVTVKLASLSDEQFEEFFAACANLAEACCDVYAAPKSEESVLFGIIRDNHVTNLLAHVLNIIRLYNPNGVVKTLLTKTKVFMDALSSLVRNMSKDYAPESENMLKDILRQIAINKRHNGEVADWAMDELFRLSTGTECNIWRQLELLERRLINENNRVNVGAEEKALLDNYKNKVYPKVSKLAYENEEYAIVVPLELADLRTEGQALHHCVGSYVSAVGKGETTIVFLRQKESIDIPFMTCEIYQNSIRQIHGLMNNNIKDQKDPDGINDFIKEWCEINKISYVHNVDRCLAAAVR